MTAGGPNEEFLGPSWQLESSPLANAIIPEWHGAKPQAPQTVSIPHGNQTKPRTWHVDESPLTAFVAEDLYLCK